MKKITALFVLVLFFAGSVSAQNVVQFDFATDVKDRQPVGVDTAFSANVGKIFCFTRIQGAADTSQIAHVWYYKEEEKARINLDVESSDWRTWSSKSILESWTGRWRVLIEDSEGNVLTSRTFMVRE